MSKVINKSGSYFHKELTVKSFELRPIVKEGTMIYTNNGSFEVTDIKSKITGNIKAPSYTVKSGEQIIENVRQSYLLKFLDLKYIKNRMLAKVVVGNDSIDVDFTVSFSDDKSFLYALSPTSENGYKYVKFKDEFGYDNVSYLESAILRLTLEIAGTTLKDKYLSTDVIKKDKYSSCRNCKACRYLSSTDSIIGDANDPLNPGKSTTEMSNGGQYDNTTVCAYSMDFPGKDRIIELNKECISGVQDTGHDTSYDLHYNTEAMDCPRFMPKELKTIPNNFHIVNATKEQIIVTTAGFSVTLNLQELKNADAHEFSPEEYRDDSQLPDEAINLRNKLRRAKEINETKSPKLEYKEGNILNATEDIIVHQVNCQGVMGAGLAGQIAKRYPNVFERYKVAVENTPDRSENLGKTLFLPIENGTKWIANLFGQYSYGYEDKEYTDYNAVKAGLKVIAELSKSKGLTVAIPYKIGAGLAGGDWSRIEAMIKEILPNATIYKLP